MLKKQVMFNWRLWWCDAQRGVSGSYEAVRLSNALCALRSRRDAAVTETDLWRLLRETVEIRHL